MPVADVPNRTPLRRSTLAQGAVFSRALARAQQAAARYDLQQAWQELRPYAGRGLSYAHEGHFWELCGRCAQAGIAPMELRPVLTRALHAYQEAHDVPGMARMHAALGDAYLAEGELASAAQEFGYAQQLSTHAGSAAQRIGSICRQAEAAVLQQQAQAAVHHAQQALAACRTLEVQGLLEAQARLFAAQACALGGQPQAAARELLWAERLLQHGAPAAPAEADGMAEAAGGFGDGAFAVALLRAETLYRMGYPRRALACLQPYTEQIPDASPQAQAHVQRLRGACLVSDDPIYAEAQLQQAYSTFARLRQGYFRTFCQLALLQTGHRLKASDWSKRWEDAGHLRLQRWPLLAKQYESIRTELVRPSVHARGAVATPWMQHQQGWQAPQAKMAVASKDAVPEAHEGLLNKLQTAWGRLRQH